MKRFILLFLILTQAALAEAPCDIQLGHSIGKRVIEFTSGNVIHSKILLKEMSISSLKEEMVSLQDEGICSEKISRKRCVLKFEKIKQTNQLTLIRGDKKWLSWSLDGKGSANKFVRILQKAGFCQ